MRQWYEYTAQHHEAVPSRENWISGNVYDETQFLRQWVDSGNLDIVNRQALYPDMMVDEIMREYHDLDKDTVDQWLNDPEYDRLMIHNGTQGRVFLHEKFDQYLRTKLQGCFPINWKEAIVEITVQRPGEVFPLHYDRKKHKHFGQGEAEIERWLIMLYDQKPGQCFFMDQHSLTWKAGDVIHWDRISVPHGSANFGYWPRWSVLITGVKDHAR